MPTIPGAGCGGLFRSGRNIEPGEKVGRLPAGTGEPGFPVLIGLFLGPNSKIKSKTAGRVPLTPHFLSKRPQKVRKKGLSPAEGMAFAGAGGFFRRSSSLPDGVFEPPRGNGPS